MKGGARVRLTVGVSVAERTTGVVFVFTAEEAVHLAGRFEGTAHLAVTAGTLARRRAAVAVLRAVMGAVAALHPIEALGLAHQLAVFDPRIALVDGAAGLSGVGGAGRVVAAAGQELSQAQRGDE